MVYRAEKRGIKIKILTVEIDIDEIIPLLYLILMIFKEMKEVFIKSISETNLHHFVCFLSYLTSKSSIH